MTKLLMILTALAIVTGCRMVFKKANRNTIAPAPDLQAYEGALYPVKKDGKWGFMNHRFEIVIPYQFTHAENFSEGIAAVSGNDEGDSQGTRYGCIDSSGKRIVGFIYDKIYACSEGLALVVKNGKFGYINKTGTEIITPQYEDGSSFSDGFAAVKKNGKNGFIDHTGKMVIEPRYARACWASEFSEGLAPVYKEDDSAGFIDTTGKQVIPANFTYVSAFSEGLALVQQKGSTLYGYIDRRGEMVIKPEYELSLPFHEGVATVKLRRGNGDAFFRIINKEGKVLADELQYSFVGIFREGLAGVETRDHRWGFIDKTGKEVVKPRFSSVRLFCNGLSMVETGHLFTKLNTSYIDLGGNLVFDGR